MRPESNWRNTMQDSPGNWTYRAEKKTKDENLTERIRKDFELKNPERKPTDAEKKADAEFVAECRRCNPFTRRYFNLTRQIELKEISPMDADLLKECAKFEGVDEKRANPGLAEGKGEKKGGKDDA